MRVKKAGAEWRVLGIRITEDITSNMKMTQEITGDQIYIDEFDPSNNRISLDGGLYVYFDAYTIIKDGDGNTMSLTGLKQTGYGNSEVLIDTDYVGTYSKTNNKISMGKNSNKDFLSWRKKQLIFDKTELGDVVKTLQQVYDVNILLKNNKLNKC